MSVSTEQMSSLYEQQGYLSGVSVLDPAELRHAREAFAQLERKFGTEYTGYSLHNVHMQYDWVRGLVKHPRVLEVVRAVLGPDILLLDSRFICKYPVSRGNRSDDVIAYENGLAGEETAGPEKQKEELVLPYVAWHQDMRYWGLDGGPVLSVWLALDDSLEDNGALQVIPGSHCSGMLHHRQSQRSGNMLSVNQEIPEELVQTDKALLCPLQAGQMSVHDGLLVHASDPNRSDRRRCGFVIRYVPTCAYPIQDPDRPRRFHATVVVSGTDQYRHFSNNEKPEL
ncbi:probable alpha-ketoglutarate-dependent hypophosphite dioxygenase [Clupea harengus]|uniref:Probable alpha-ketoglutarate-dependent hypophosphite dioxygenase n=1 Tax=Clupea harengus TaxID=7950 RepID=A0A6P8ENV9_CLUHA|nr:probable alpha-ketoglutarate-dependent hypophosphite dioxygenase [Clupea harengus]XP_031413795.1 probable alpha-ketoglutarate-dependent hypophosphite dioxygenase [Clupea harengus]